jgi:hypothetical protein
VRAALRRVAWRCHCVLTAATAVAAGPAAPSSMRTYGQRSHGYEAAAVPCGRQSSGSGGLRGALVAWLAWPAVWLSDCDWRVCSTATQLCTMHASVAAPKSRCCCCNMAPGCLRKARCVTSRTAVIPAVYLVLLSLLWRWHGE